MNGLNDDRDFKLVDQKVGQFPKHRTFDVSSSVVDIFWAFVAAEVDERQPESILQPTTDVIDVGVGVGVAVDVQRLCVDAEQRHWADDNKL